jgi:hypothetical protein
MGDVIKVRRQWNEWRIATYPRDGVWGFHWSVISGGIQARLPQPLLHAYVLCDGMLEGELAHSCLHGDPPHEIKVVVLKKDNPELWEELAAEAGPRPKQPTQAERCLELVRLLSEKEWPRWELALALRVSDRALGRYLRLIKAAGLPLRRKRIRGEVLYYIEWPSTR